MSRELVEHFYTSFADTDAEAMVECYADDVVFEDPAFGELHGDEARDMWRMLCERSSDLSIEYTVLEASDTAAKVNWVANYTFSTGRHVRNDITATMQIADGKIVDHRDEFSFWAWSRQALGFPGVLVGWSPRLQSKVRTTARESLERYRSKNS